jgi:hypothetical protein
MKHEDKEQRAADKERKEELKEAKELVALLDPDKKKGK